MYSRFVTFFCFAMWLSGQLIPALYTTMWMQTSYTYNFTESRLGKNTSILVEERSSLQYRLSQCRYRITKSHLILAACLEGSLQIQNYNQIKCTVFQQTTREWTFTQFCLFWSSTAKCLCYWCFCSITTHTHTHTHTHTGEKPLKKHTQPNSNKLVHSKKIPSRKHDKTTTNAYHTATT